MKTRNYNNTLSMQQLVSIDKTAALIGACTLLLAAVLSALVN